MTATKTEAMQRFNLASKMPQSLVSLTYLMLWAAFSSAVIVYMKLIYAGGFPYPLAVTGLGQAAAVVAGLGMAAGGMMPLLPAPSPTFFLMRVCPISLAFTATLFFGNAAYLYLSVAYIQILKSFTPAMTLLLAASFGLERMSSLLLLAVLLIAAGTGGATLVESGTASFHWWGFTAFMLSAVTEGLRAVLAQMLMGRERYNTVQVLVYISAPTALLLLGCSAVWELPAMLASGALAAQSERLALHGAAYATSAAVNLLGYLAIHHSSSLTFKVAGCLKNVAVAAYGVMEHGDAVTPGQVLGYLVSMAGFLLYSQAKWRDSKQKQN